ncbi:MAG: RNA 3'-terminal phosphate cyclase [Nitrososphaerota archaeon]|nr:RNA 3'-terminal phosphate cyclase [Nitrososphaerota archaeon]
MSYLEIDGSQGEGGGQIIRTALSLATIFQRSIHITNIRAGRKEPGLRPQHLQSVIAASKLCDGRLGGASVGSTEIIFAPREPIRSFTGSIDTGTAGSISLIAQTIIPISIFCGTKLVTVITGGTEVSNSPTIDYLERLVFPIYRQIGADISIQVARRGYYPRGGGIVKLSCTPGQPNSQIEFEEQEREEQTKILSVSRGLPNHVSERQLDSAKSTLLSSNMRQITSELDYAGDSASPGSSVLVYRADRHSLVGGSSLGEKGKRSEVVGREAAVSFLQESEASPNVDSHLSDMLVTLASCLKGESQFTTPVITEHFKTNSAVAQQITGCEVTFRQIGRSWQVKISGHK